MIKMDKQFFLPSDIASSIDNTNDIDCSKSTLDSLKKISKTIYDHIHRNNSLTELKPKSFRKLLIDGFDAEQIFQQIELQNRSALVHFQKELANFNDADITQSNMEEDSSGDEEDKFVQNYGDSDKTNLSSKKKEFIYDDDDSDSSDDMADIEKPDTFSDDEIEEDFEKETASDGEEEIDSSKSHTKAKNKTAKNENITKSKYKSVVDDQFFKLADMEQFLKVEDLRAEDKLEDSADEEDNIDYFQDISSEEDMEDSEEDLEKSSNDVMYNGFFDAPESGEEKDLNENDMSDQDLNNFELDENEMNDSKSDLTDSDEDKDDVKKENKSISSKDGIPKTVFELQQEKVKETISNYEDSMLKKAEWHLTGEIAATSRPKDSLLHQETDFDINARPALVEDEKLEEQTENAIKNIIKNKAFNDGQRKHKPDNTTLMKKEIVLEQNKSKKSLAEVYENEYLKKKYGEEEKEDPKHVEIKKMMDTLLPELQALFSHIPKPAIPDIKIVSNLPAITVEEVAPTSISDVTLLAPEEVKKKSGLVKGHSERTDTDRKRERRKKKLLQKMKYKKMENETTADGNSTKSKKQSKLDALKKVKQHRNTKIADMDSEKIKSSKDFFSRLQETVNSKAQPSQSKKRKT